MALFAKHVGEYGAHAVAKQAGFRKEDVIVAFAGSSARETESQLIGRLLERYQPGDTVPVTVLRGSERIEVTLPMQ